MTREEILEAALENALEMICDEWGIPSLESLVEGGWSGKEDLIEGAKLILERHERVQGEAG